MWSNAGNPSSFPTSYGFVYQAETVFPAASTGEDATSHAGSRLAMVTMDLLLFLFFRGLLLLAGPLLSRLPWGFPAVWMRRAWPFEPATPLESFMKSWSTGSLVN